MCSQKAEIIRRVDREPNAITITIKRAITITYYKYILHNRKVEKIRQKASRGVGEEPEGLNNS